MTAMADEIVQFPTFNISLGDAIVIIKYHLDNPDVAIQSKVLAVEKVANMETHNSITKDDLIKALRWLFFHYDFEG